MGYLLLTSLLINAECRFVLHPVSSLARRRPPPALACRRRPPPSSSTAIVDRRSCINPPSSAAAVIVANPLSPPSLVAVSRHRRLSSAVAVLPISRIDGKRIVQQVLRFTDFVDKVSDHASCLDERETKDEINGNIRGCCDKEGGVVTVLSSIRKMDVKTDVQFGGDRRGVRCVRKAGEDDSQS